MEFAGAARDMSTSSRKGENCTLVSLDGVFDSPQDWGLANFQDDAYLHDGLGLMLACDAMLMGRRTYEIIATIYSSRTDPWAVRLNAMRKYVFSSTLEKADWDNSTVVRGDVVAEVIKLKQQEGRDLLIWGPRSSRGGFAEKTADRRAQRLGSSRRCRPRQAVFREGQNANLKLVMTKTFSKGIAKLTYEPQ